MLPSKSMMEYMSEMHRLFPRTESGNDLSAPFLFSSDPTSLQSTMVNRSSSSTDSTSPESYLDLSFRCANYRAQATPRLQDTPFSTRPQRAIVGRKILGNSHQTTRLMSPGDKIERDFNFWQHEEALSVTPPGNTIQPKKFEYELFPSESKTFEFKTPVKSESKMLDMSTNFLDWSPLSNNSPVNRNLSSRVSNHSYKSQSLSDQSYPHQSYYPQSSTWSNSGLGSTLSSQRIHGLTSSPPSPQYISKYQKFGACSSTDELAPATMCTFCRKNGETPIVYMTHSVKEQVGGKNVVTCPILRSHVCGTCGASGDNAHTITYCPVLRSHNNGKPLQSTTITLKNTRIKSNGRRRY